ncbi:type II toxin-antitoxin system death-on-curing family toxin [Candidatus Saccharibacteria bacterium]|nr:type II toxin-antitoxin system death-on-curing family toxin [Candidatus Saccharibacteria bacterium]
MIHYITANDIVAIHDMVIKEIGGKLGVREPGLLVSIAEKPKTAFGKSELYPDVFTKAAVLYEALCNYHVFIDGNKRTALLVMFRFLHINGYQLIATNEEAVSYTLFIAKKKPELNDIARWINSKSKKGIK